MKLAIFSYGYVNWDKVFIIINDLHPTEIICDGINSYTVLENYCMQNGIEYINRLDSLHNIISNSDRVIVSYEKSESVINANCNKAHAENVMEIAWQLLKPVKTIEEIEYPVKPWITTEYCGMVHLMEERHYQYEKKDKEYWACTDYHYYYESPELLDDNIKDYLLLTIYGFPYRVTIKAIDFNWIESLIENEFPELYGNKLDCDVNLHYKKGEINILLFSCKGYSRPWFEKDRVSIEQLFDELYNSEYSPYQKAFEGNEVPNLKINKVDESNLPAFCHQYYKYDRFHEKKEKTINSIGLNFSRDSCAALYLGDSYPSHGEDLLRDDKPHYLKRYAKYRKDYNHPNQ